VTAVAPDPAKAVIVNAATAVRLENCIPTSKVGPIDPARRPARKRRRSVLR
jgi:hypothetical protein